MYLPRRLLYYLTSVVTLLRHVRNPSALLRLLTRHRGPVVLMLSDGTRYAVRSLMDAWIVKETNLDRDYERFGTPIQDGWTIIDVGAGLGDFTLFAAKRTPHGRVFAYEPAPDSVDLLRRNLELNAVDNVEVLPHAVGSKEGVLELDVSGGVAVQYRTVGKTSDSAAHIEVRSVALDVVLAGLPDGRCDFLKIDVEGAEYDMLLGLDAVELQRVRRVCLEYHEGVSEHTHVDLEQYFTAQGWLVRVYPSQVQPKLGFLYAENVAASSV